MQVAEATSHGAISVMNAMATGMGAALGVNLWTRAKVSLTNQPGSFKGRNLTDADEGVELIETTARKTFERFGAHRHFGALIETESNIPVAVGLKSSSAASNAVALAALRVLKKSVRPLVAINLAVEASLQANVTLTGAFDDACACYYGGLIVTNNTRRRILKHCHPNSSFSIMLHVPAEKRYSGTVDSESLGSIKPLMPTVLREVLNGNYWLALTLNGFLYSNALGCDDSPAKSALENGALAAGISGKGPATAAVVRNERLASVLDAWSSYPGRVIRTAPNYEVASTAGLSD